jgi:hypothetical protein
VVECTEELTAAGVEVVAVVARMELAVAVETGMMVVAVVELVVTVVAATVVMAEGTVGRWWWRWRRWQWWRRLRCCNATKHVLRVGDGGVLVTK